MSKKILILETSVTLQKLFTTTLDSDDYQLQFINDGKAAIYTLLEEQPDLFLVNTDIQEPRSFEVVRLVRALDCFKDLTIGMYSNVPSPLDEAFAADCGATQFVRLDQKTLVLNVDELSQLPSRKIDRSALAQIKKNFDDSYLFNNATKLLLSDSYRNAMFARILEMVDQLEDLEDIVRTFLLLIAEVCEVPIAGLYITENDGPHGYYVCSENITDKDVADFLSVCAADFEKVQSDYNAAKITPHRLETKTELNRFYNTKVQLSSYESADLKSSDGNTYFGTVHIVSEGNITSSQHNFFDFCASRAGIVFDKAITVKKKIFFERRIRRAFSRFVPEQIIDDLVAKSDNTDEKLGVGETRTVAILFSDIRSFTNISEKNKPDVLVAFLNRYFSTMVDIIKKHGGTVDKFIGDAIMAIFGSPVSYEDNSHRAVSAAYEMRDALESLEIGDLVLPDGMKFNIGIGIHYGDVIAGSLGSKDKTDYTVIGDSVTLASRLEGLTKVYGVQVLISESVMNDAGKDAFCYRHLDDVRVKGKKNAVPIYAVDRNEKEFSREYKDAYIKGMDLYHQGIFHLARDYFEKAYNASAGDKAAKLMLSRCDDFIANPPENWDGAIAFTTK